MAYFSDEIGNRIISDLAESGFSVTPNFLRPELVSELRQELNLRVERGLLKAARVGRGSALAEAPEIRNDSISWLDEATLTTAERDLFSILEEFRHVLNRELFLGLRDFEIHYARYPQGHFYKRHVDRFQMSNARTISLVLYLNENWLVSDGGQLRLFPKTREAFEVLPEGGTLVCFKSDELEHEVLPSTTRERLSLAAWMRR